VASLFQNVWVNIVVASLLLATLYLSLRGASFFKEKHNRVSRDQLTRLTRDERRGFLRLSFDNLPKIISCADWRPELQRLNQQRRVGPLIVDVERTVIAVATTLSPQLIFTQRRFKPNYLFIIEVRRPRDHLAAMARLIASSLSEQSVPTELREYRGDPGLLSPGSNGSTESLSTLSARFPNHRLILVATGDEAVDSARAELRSVKQFELWTEKYLMTPRKPSAYGRTEAAFFRAGFQVVGMGKQGLRRIGELLNSPHLQDLSRYTRPPLTILGQEDERWLDPLPPSPEVVQELVSHLEVDLGRTNFLWMAACAVFPMLVPELTEYLGAVLQDNGNPRLGTEGGYIELSKLPWFREGTMPDWLRLALIAKMPSQLTSDVRNALLKVMSRAAPPNVVGKPRHVDQNVVEIEITRRP
jgi:hypothetical protein